MSISADLQGCRTRSGLGESDSDRFHCLQGHVNPWFLVALVRIAFWFHCLGGLVNLGSLCLGSSLPAIPAQLVGSSLPLDSSTDFGLRPNRSVSKYGAVTLRGMNTTYVHEGSPVCLHSWPRDLVGWNQSSWKRFRVLKRARVFKIRMVALQGWRHRDAILCRGGQTPGARTPLDLQVRVSRLSLCRNANDALLRHQLPSKLQEHRRRQGLGEDVRLLVVRRHPLEQFLPLLHRFRHEMVLGTLQRPH